MRLGSAIALELAVVAGAVGGVWLGVGHAVQLAGDYMGAREASAATIRMAPVAAPQLVRLPAPTLTLDARVVAASTSVFGASDDELLAPLGATPVTRVKPNKGGTSLSLRLDFASGARAVFKPEQIHPQSDPRREVAAYRMDRLLGIGRVQPAKPIKLGYQELLAAADPTYRTYTTNRILEEVISKKGEVKGVVSWWLPEIRPAKLDKLLLDEPDGMKLWASYLQVGATIPPEHRALVEQVATLVVFDVVIDNADRWSGGNTKTSPDGKTLYFMDNTLSFSHFKYGHEANLAPLRRIQVFPRGLVTKLRALTLETVRATLDLGEDPTGLAPLLDDAELRAIMSRRNHVILYVDELIAKYGEDAVLALP